MGVVIPDVEEQPVIDQMLMRAAIEDARPLCDWHEAPQHEVIPARQARWEAHWGCHCGSRGIALLDDLCKELVVSSGDLIAQCPHCGCVGLARHALTKLMPL